ncbi:MAG: amidase domain-containing protein [Romboutsia sp.]|uniref:amidase domain-containing protein n=1 Tax=Romboutsia sp. TaxID=1965302 RepID=UPI003F35EC2E
MKQIKEYDRDSAVAYARKWALSHNPKYANYEDYGGDCTNYISQCIKVGNIPFDNVGKDVLKKWYWYSDNYRTPTWSAADPFYKYITGNNKKGTDNFGIYARLADYNELEIGDLVQLIHDGKAYHTMIITKVILDGEYLSDYLVCQHTYNLLDYPLSLKQGEKRYIKILGYYNW